MLHLFLYSTVFSLNCADALYALEDRGIVGEIWLVIVLTYEVESENSPNGEFSDKFVTYNSNPVFNHIDQIFT